MISECQVCGSDDCIIPPIGPGLVIKRIGQKTKEPEVAKYTLTDRVYVNIDKTRIVDESDPDAHWLLGSYGDAIDYDLAVRLGLAKTKDTTITVPQRFKSEMGTYQAKFPDEEEQDSDEEDSVKIDPDETKELEDSVVEHKEVESESTSHKSIDEPLEKKVISGPRNKKNL